MPHHQEVNLPTSWHPEDEKVSSNQGDTEILGDQREGDVYNISFDESQHKFVQSCRMSTLDDHTSPAQVEERVIVFDVRKHLATLADATRVYAKAIRSSVHFLIADNEWMDKELHMTKQGGELVTMSTWAELKKAILNEVLSLDIVMWALYSKFGTVHKAVIHLNGWQQRCARREHILANSHDVVDYIQTWMMRYKGALLHLPKMMKARVVEPKACIRSWIWNYEELPQLIASI